MNIYRVLGLLEDLASGRLDDRIDQARAYVDNHFYRAEIVQALPANPDPGHFYVVPGDINLYIGGQGGTYRKIPTQPGP